MALYRFMVVPEHIYRDGIATHGFGHPVALLPVLPRDARGMHFAADDLKAFAVKQDVVLPKGETMLGGEPFFIKILEQNLDDE